MTQRPTESLTKVTLNLFTSDVSAFRRRYGFGWSEQIRLLVHTNCVEHSRQRKVIDLIAEDSVDGEEA